LDLAARIGPKAKARAAFWLRFALLFVASRLPVPFVADLYAATFAGAANVGFAVVNHTQSSVALHLEPPERIHVLGSWKPLLHIEERATGQTRTIPLNVKIFSYYLMATFLALALATPLAGARRQAIVIGGGLAATAAVSTALTALPVLVEYAVTGALGAALGSAVETAYMGVLTPAMAYLVPVLIWWLLVSLTRTDAGTW
jgi:hypothetical protein